MLSGNLVCDLDCAPLAVFAPAAWARFLVFHLFHFLLNRCFRILLFPLVLVDRMLWIPFLTLVFALG